MPQNIHLITGEDDFLTDRAARAVVARVVPADLADAALVETVDGAGPNEEVQRRALAACEASVMTPPFLEPFKVTWWRNVDFLPHKKVPGAAMKARLEKFARALAASPLPENQHLVITAPEVLASSAFGKALAPVAEVVQFASGKYAKDRAEAAAANVLAFAGELGLKADAETARALVARAGTDARTLMSELAKLRDYLGPGADKVTREAVDAVASPGGDEPEPWDLTDAVGARDAARALAVLARYEDVPGNGIRLANALEKHFRQLAVAKDAQTRGVGDQETLAAAGLALAPFQMRKVFAAAGKYSALELRAARYRFLAVREQLVSGGDAPWRALLEKELLRALPRRGARK